MKLKRVAVWFPALLAIVLLAVGCSMVQRSSTVAAPAVSLRVLSYNVRVDFQDYQGHSWEQRGAAIVRFIEETSPDIIGIQETTENQLVFLQHHLPDYFAFAGERSDGHTGQKWYEYVPVFYKKSRFQLRQKSSFWLSEDPSAPGSTFIDSKWHGRTTAWIKLWDRHAERELTLMNTHTHGKQPAKAVALLKAKARDVAAGGPLILMGDFNFTPDNLGYKLLTRNSSEGPVFADAHDAAQQRFGETITVFGKGGASQPRRIDYIFLAGLGPVVSYRVTRVLVAGAFDASDHLPVLADLFYPSS